MPRPSAYSPSEKARLSAEARTMLREGATRKQAADHLQVKLHSLSGWLREETLDLLYPPVRQTTMPRARRGSLG